jgi:16S rRNA (guanine1207-N2)-methyltransferase
MSGHYFENNPVKDTKQFVIPVTFQNRSFTFFAHRGVFSKKTLDDGTRLLLKVLLQETLRGPFLDLGCGYGPLGCILASFHPQLDMTLVDINERAVVDAKHNAHQLGLHLHVLVSDGFKELTQMFFGIAFNPPIRAGKEIIYDLYRQAKEHLLPNGSMFIVIRKDKGALSHVNYLQTLFANVQLLTRDKGYHVYKAQV